jgi:tape measure domain-containing protein
MPELFSLYGTIGATTTDLQSALRFADARLKETSQTLVSTEKKARDLGQTTATSARSFEKLQEKVSQSKVQLIATASAFSKGEATAKQMQSAIHATTRATDQLNSKLKDLAARQADVQKSGGGTGFLGNFQNRLGGITQPGTTAASFAGTAAGNLAASAISETTQLLKTGASAWLDYASNLEQARIGFTTMTGSVVTADRHLKELQDFAKKTPFEFSELVDASRKLQGVGFSAEQVIPILKDVGNSLAAAGRISELPFAIKALGDIQAKGKLAGQEIIQLANAGIPIRAVLAKELGVTSAELVQLGEDGKISAEIVFAALHKMSEERFGDAMEKQSHTFAGAMSNIKDAVFQTSEVAFRPFYAQISKLADNTAKEIADLGGDFEAVGEVIGRKLGEAAVIAFDQLLRTGFTRTINSLPLPDPRKPSFKSFVSNTEDFLTDQTGLSTSFVGAGSGYGRGILAAILGEAETKKREAALRANTPEFLNQIFDVLGVGLDRGPTTAIDAVKNAFNKPPVAAKNPKDLAKDILENNNKTQSEAISLTKKLNLAYGEQALAIARANASRTDSIADIKKIADLEEKAIRGQIQAVRDAASEKILLAKDQSELNKINTQTLIEVGRLETEIAVNRINSAERVAAKEKELVEKRKQSAKDLRDIIVNSAISTSQNPYVRIFSDAQTALEKFRETAKNLPASLQKLGVGALAQQFGAGLFSQRIQTAVEGSDLLALADKFRGKAQFAPVFTAAGGKLGTQTLLGTLPAAFNKSFTAEQLQTQKELDRRIKAVNSAQIPADLDPKIAERIRNNSITDLVRNQNPEDLNNAQRNLAADVLTKEATNLAKQQVEAEQLFENLNKVVQPDGILVKLGEGEQIVRVVNEAPDRAKVERRPSSSSTKRRYE